MSTPTKEDLLAAITAYSPADSRPGFAKALEISGCESVEALRAAPEKWAGVIAGLKARTSSPSEQAFDRILDRIEETPDGAGTAKDWNEIAPRITGARDVLSKQQVAALIEAIHRKIPGKTLAGIRKQLDARWHKAAAAASGGYELISVCAADVKVEKLDFLWPGVMPRKYLFLLGGDPGVNKSTCTVDVAARMSREDFWPCSGERAPAGNTLFITAEDRPEDVIVPRLIEAGANLNRVFFAKGKVDADGKESGIDLGPESLVAIEKDIQKRNASLVIVDPVSAYLAGVDSHNDAEVRAMLMPVQEIAARNNCVIVLVLHFNKDNSKSGVHRLMGSVAFGATCRAAYAVVKDRTDPKKRHFLPIKANLAPDTRGFEFRIEDSNGQPKITWGAEFSSLTIEEALMPEDQPSKKDRAGLIIQTALGAGEIERTALFALTKSKGIGAKATYAALNDLGMKAQPSAFGGKWVYRLTESETATDEEFDKPESVPAAPLPAQQADEGSVFDSPDVGQPEAPKSNGHDTEAASALEQLFDADIQCSSEGDADALRKSVKSAGYSYGLIKKGCTVRGVTQAQLVALVKAPGRAVRQQRPAP